MITTQPSDPGNQGAPIPSDMLKALIGRHVVRSLGSPGDMLGVRVHPVGTDRFRVNVLVGKNAASARIADSFFVTADGEGNIVTSSPRIARLY